MSDASAVWKSGGEALKGAIRASWPALAAALEGSDDAQAQVELRKICTFCDVGTARGTLGGHEICAACVGRMAPEKRVGLEKWAGR